MSYSQPGPRWMRIIGWGLVVLPLVPDISSLIPDGVLSTAFAFGAMLLVILWLVHYMMAFMARRNAPMWTGEQTVSFDETGMRGGAAGASGYIQWPAVTRVVETRYNVLLFVSNRVSCSIPRAPLAEAGLEDEFLRLARSGASGELGPVRPVGYDEEIGERFRGTFRWTVRGLYDASMELARYGQKIWPFVAFMALLAWINGGDYAFQQWREGGWSAVPWSLLGLALFPVLMMLAIRPVLSIWSARSHMRSSRSAGHEQVIRIGDEGVASQGGMTSGAFRWESMPKVIETPRHFLFFLNRYSGLAFPKNALRDDPLAVRAFLAEKLGTKFRVK